MPKGHGLAPLCQFPGSADPLPRTARVPAPWRRNLAHVPNANHTNDMYFSWANENGPHIFCNEITAAPSRDEKSKSFFSNAIKAVSSLRA